MIISQTTVLSLERSEYKKTILDVTGQDKNMEVVTPGMHELCDFLFCDLFWVPENMHKLWICLFSSMDMLGFFTPS